jgi:hypothetical protein
MKNKHRKRRFLSKGLVLSLVLAQAVSAFPVQADLAQDDIRDAIIESLLDKVLGFSTVTKNDDKDSDSKESGLLDQIENRYHVNKKKVAEYGDIMNASVQKGQAPEVQIFFTPTDPKPGQEVSANAFPSFFSNTKENLYFTWYLKHKECDAKTDPNGEERRLCDRNEDDKIDVEDWKIEAMRFIARGGSDIQADAYEKSDDESDKDGYVASLGGADKENVRSGNQYCYLHDFSSGKNYELVGNASSNGKFFYEKLDTSDSVIKPYVRDVCENDDRYDSLCDTSLESYDSSYASFCSAMADFRANTCTAPSDDFTAAVNAEKARRAAENLEIKTEGQADCAERKGAFSASSNGTRWQCQVDNDDAAEKSCQHLFPKAWKMNEKGEVSGGETLVGADDGAFSRNEERFWGTDPKDPSTAQNGNKDEANVVGLGRDVLRWPYAAGDEVGVVVEGTSMIPTKHEDASMMTMWAFLNKQRCSPDSTGSYTKDVDGYDYKVTIETAEIEDMNKKCLEKNLVSPTDGSQAGKLDVSASFSPQNPVASFASGPSAPAVLGDVLTVQASISNSTADPSRILYDWTVSMSSDGSDWKPVAAKDLIDAGVTAKTNGGGLSALRLDLNFDEKLDFKKKYFSSNDTAYMRVKVEARENFAAGAVRRGTSEVVVKMVNADKNIVAYAAKAGDTGGLSLGEAICDGDGAERTNCPVVKNQIVGLSFPDASDYDTLVWSLNGKPLVCSSSVSAECKENAQPANFFPVTGNPGETYTATLAASDTESGKSLTLTRVFTVVEPTFSIVPTDEDVVWKKYLGEYVDLDGKVVENYSEKVFQGFSGKETVLKPSVYPAFLKDNVDFEWLVDGESMEKDKDGNLTLFLGKDPNGTYNVALEGFYAQPNEIRKALRDIWGISALDSAETNLAASVQIELVASEDEGDATAGLMGRSGKFFAAIASYVPPSVLLFFRLLASMGLVLFVSGLTLGLAPVRRT